MKYNINKLFLLLGLTLCSLVLASCSSPKSSDDPEEEQWTWNKKDKDDEKDNKDDKEQTVSAYPKPDGYFRIVTYNVGSLGKVITSVSENASMVAAMMKEIEADVVGLNELDSVNTRHNVNEVALLADAMGGWQWHFGRAMAYKNGAYGNGVIVPSGTKIVDKYTVALPKGSGSEPRSIAVVETDKYVIGAAHLDHMSEEASIEQARTVNRWVEEHYRNCSKPVFFCGDMNSYPTSEAIKTLETEWERLSSTANTAPAIAPTSCIDYIFHYRKSASVTSKGGGPMTRFSDGDVTKASDHLPVYVDVKF